MYKGGSQMLIGIDASKNGTGVCIRGKSKTILYTYTKHLPKKIKEFYLDNNNFVVIAKQQLYPDTLSDFEQLRHIRETIFRDISPFITGDAKFFFEGYSMGGNGRITMLAELTSLLKDSVYEMGYRINGIYAPTSVKKVVGGKGNMKKDEIYDSCWNNSQLKELMENIEEDGHKFKNDCWQIDVLDAWAVSEMGRIQEES